MHTEAGPHHALVDELLERIGQSVGERANVAAVFGEPVEREGLTVIPVAKTRFGFGGGGGSGGGPREVEGSGGGGGGGAAVTPIGFIEMHGGTAEFRRITRPADVLAFVAAAAVAVLTLKRLLD